MSQSSAYFCAAVTSLSHMFSAIAVVTVLSSLLFTDSLLCGFFQLQPLSSRVCQQWCQAMVSVFPALSGSPWPHNRPLCRLGSNTELTSSSVIHQWECSWRRSTLDPDVGPVTLAAPWLCKRPFPPAAALTRAAEMPRVTVSCVYVTLKQ